MTIEKQKNVGEIDKNILNYALEMYGEGVGFLVGYACKFKTDEALNEWLIETLPTAGTASKIIKPVLLRLCGLRQFDRWLGVMNCLERERPSEFKKMANLFLSGRGWIQAWLDDDARYEMTKFGGMNNISLTEENFKKLLEFSKKISPTNKTESADYKVKLTEEMARNMSTILVMENEELFSKWVSEWLVPRMNLNSENCSEKAYTYYSEVFNALLIKNITQENVNTIIDVALIDSGILHIDAKNYAGKSEIYIVGGPWFSAVKKIIEIGKSPLKLINILEDESFYDLKNKFESIVMGSAKLGTHEPIIPVIQWWQRNALQKNVDSISDAVSKKTNAL